MARLRIPELDARLSENEETSSWRKDSKGKLLDLCQTLGMCDKAVHRCSPESAKNVSVLAPDGVDSHGEDEGADHVHEGRVDVLEPKELSACLSRTRLRTCMYLSETTRGS